MNSDRAEMNDVIDFLDTWLDEDERAARDAAEETGKYLSSWAAAQGGGATWVSEDGGVYTAGASHPFATDPYGDGLGAPGAHVARHDPARVLRDVEVVRQAIANYRSLDRALIRGDHDDTDPGWHGIQAGRDVLKNVLVAHAKAAGWTSEQL